MGNQRGQLTVEFLFTFAIAIGVFTVIFTLMFTLSVVEITQYVVYSSARSHAAASVDIATQQANARARYQKLTAQSALASLYFGTWFSISSPQELDVRSGYDRMFSNDLAGGDDLRQQFMGVSTKLTAMLLNFQLPLLGSTSPDGEGFSTNVNGILIREPSQKECMDFFETRRAAIGTLPASQGGYYEPTKYLPMEDNGC
jgi:hypothetical protein